MFLMSRVESAMRESTSAAEKAPSVLYSLYCDSVYKVRVWVRPMMFPLITETAPNSPIARCKQQEIPFRPLGDLLSAHT